MDPHAVFFSDVTLEVAEPWISQLKPQSVASFASTVDSTAWETGLVPCTYMMCEKDEAIYFWLQQKMLDDVIKESERPWKVEKTASGHSAWLTEVPTVVRLIEDAAAAETAA